MNQNQDLNDRTAISIKSEMSKKMRIPSKERIRSIKKDRNKWVKLLIDQNHLGNRRRILAESMDLGISNLREITGWGKSTASDLLRTSVMKESTREIGREFIAHFGIFTRSSYSLITDEDASLEWEDTLFRLIERDCIDVEELNKQIHIALADGSRFLKGIVLKSQGKKLYLRFERRNGLVIIDLANADLTTFRIFSDILRNTEISWNYLFYPTIFPNKEFLIFVGNADESRMQELLNEDLCWADKWDRLYRST
ncbi:hypothetical protein [Paenibacillus sp. R14(2021)]|uniref:hypothetical protein n=1 Tax=Paenibacillus sp. R14(2021) TaxID=2859228 RepID=UPI001C612BA7|nr:hypothetical protein [Paenibacillus sp. R14(2021)]